MNEETKKTEQETEISEENLENIRAMASKLTSW